MFLKFVEFLGLKWMLYLVQAMQEKKLQSGNCYIFWLDKQMCEYINERNKISNDAGGKADTMFTLMIKNRVKADFLFNSLMNNEYFFPSVVFQQFVLWLMGSWWVFKWMFFGVNSDVIMHVSLKNKCVVKMQNNFLFVHLQVQHEYIYHYMCVSCT